MVIFSVVTTNEENSCQNRKNPRNRLKFKNPASFFYIAKIPNFGTMSYHPHRATLAFGINTRSVTGDIAESRIRKGYLEEVEEAEAPYSHSH